MNTTHDLELPSGSEVESTMLRMRDRLDTWKTRGVVSARSQATKVQDSMRTNPMKWAGIAAGTGFALGILGRLAHARNNRKNAIPTLVIVEANC